MLITDIISVLSSPVSTVIVGSVVGAGVGFFLNYETTRMTRKAEQKKAIKEHIKEFSNLVLQVNVSVECEKERLWGRYEYPDNIREKIVTLPECPIDELIMLTILDLPELKKVAIDLKESIIEVRGSYDNFEEGNYPIENHNLGEGDTYGNQHYAAILREAFGRFDTSYSNLLASIESIGCKYR